MRATEPSARASERRHGRRKAVGTTANVVAAAPNPSCRSPGSGLLAGRRPSAFSEDQLKKMIVEMTSANKRNWSHETIAATTAGGRGSVHQVMASLARGPLTAEERDSLMIPDLGDEDGPITPDWWSLEQANVLHKLREAKARVYAEGSQPKLRTALNHWLRYTGRIARVSFLRPPVVGWRRPRGLHDRELAEARIRCELSDERLQCRDISCLVVPWWLPAETASPAGGRRCREGG